MRVAMYYSNSDVRVEERPFPVAGRGEVLVRILASGICGSDVMEWYRIHKVPLVLGHEISGEISEVGDGINHLKKGDRVSAAHHVPCNTCHYCLTGHHTVCETLRKTNFDPGGFSEFVRLSAINVDRGLFHLPDEVSFEEATFIEPLACVYRGLKQARMEIGHTVLVIGSGISGLLHIQMAKALGAGRIIATDINDYRLSAAERSGAGHILRADENVPARVRQLNDKLGADIVILCTGAPDAITQALQSVERAGTILFFAPSAQGVSIPLAVNDLFWRNEITLTSSYAGSPSDHVTALELIRSRRIDVKSMITHRLGLAETGIGFQMVAHPKDSIKVIIEPQR